jgi:hypothetical protein
MCVRFDMEELVVASCGRGALLHNLPAGALQRQHQ